MPIFQNISKQNKNRQNSCSRDCGSGRGDHWWHMLVDPRGRLTFVAGSDHYFCTCRPFVRPSPLFKTKLFKTIFQQKQCSLLARLWVWPSGSLMTHVLLYLVFFGGDGDDAATEPWAGVAGCDGTGVVLVHTQVVLASVQNNGPTQDL